MPQRAESENSAVPVEKAGSVGEVLVASADERCERGFELQYMYGLDRRVFSSRASTLKVPPCHLTERERTLAVKLTPQDVAEICTLAVESRLLEYPTQVSECLLVQSPLCVAGECEPPPVECVWLSVQEEIHIGLLIGDQESKIRWTDAGTYKTFQDHGKPKKIERLDRLQSFTEVVERVLDARLKEIGTPLPRCTNR